MLGNKKIRIKGPKIQLRAEAHKAQTVLIKGKWNQVLFKEHNEKKQRIAARATSTDNA